MIASEMLIITQDVRNKEAYYASLHSFIRNTEAGMEFGDVLLNKYLNKQPALHTVEIGESAEFTLRIQPKGGFVITNLPSKHDK